MALNIDGYTFSLDSQISRRPVRYRNRYGIEMAADLYMAISLDRSLRYPGIVVGPPHSGVKEQGPGVYAQELAKRGFVTLAFDPSYNGESGGAPRRLTSPEIFAEDFSAAVDHLGSLPFVDRDRIGSIGLCGSGGFALNAAQVDTRIKAVATAAMYDISGVKRDGWKNQGTDEQRRALLKSIAAQRWKDVDEGAPALEPTFPSEFDIEELDPVTAEFFEYYVTARGRHPRSVGAFTITSEAAHVNFGAVRHLEDIAPRPILLITGEHAHSRYFSEDVYSRAPGPKELVVVAGARHIDLYDRTDMIPFDKLEEFFLAAF
ncbi:alpha/beta hydrolase [Arthrobacter sp. AK01]|uniref:alpha/beta hydrolase n=1 Tax=Arthrobacter sp. AK01 TaxID=2894084 RepID=UPI001E36ACBE|nr:alpha/beta hydrolase [Arthrobacter sp. AK01]MCD4850607.1 alpha/beta hydrolase [Arthrobacter sp. AK01]